MIRIGVDSGGTFTDFVVADESGIRVFKLPSTPMIPAEALLGGIANINANFILLHGTTVATNAILERKLAKTAFITNEGFRDILHLGRQTRPQLYDLEPRLPEPPCKSDHCFTVKGRLLPDGTVSHPLEISLPDLSAYESAAVCLLFSYANPDHEKQVADALPKHLFVSLSHEVSPEFREYERAIATALNAAVGPLMSNYLKQISGQSGAESVYVMSSAGGLFPVSEAINMPIRTVTSGPAAGVAATHSLSKKHGRERVIAFDMGGTSTDVSLIDGEPAATSLSEISGLPVRLHRYDIHTIGCGGGSIAHLDAAGALQVGPQSAGSDPGPALYGKSEKFTVTDANFLLGRLPIFRFAAREKLGLDVQLPLTAATEMADELGIQQLEFAEAVTQRADAQMAAAIRKVSSAKGLDPADFTLVSYGGSGALHACSIAEELGIREIMIPFAPGVFSAFGLLLAPFSWEESLTVLGKSEGDWERIYGALEISARAKLGKDGDFKRFADMRYRGQSHEITVAANSLEDTRKLFEREHESRYGMHFEGREVQWVTARVRLDSEQAPPILSKTNAHVPELPKTWRCYRGGAWLDCELVNREEVSAISCPAIVLSDDSTILIHIGWRGETLDDGTLVLRKD